MFFSFFLLGFGSFSGVFAVLTSWGGYLLFIDGGMFCFWSRGEEELLIVVVAIQPFRWVETSLSVRQAQNTRHEK